MTDVSLNDPVSGKYVFAFESDSDKESFRDDYEFSEEVAGREWDYFAEREARLRVMEESDPEEESRPSESLDVRFKDLPPKFQTQSRLDFLQNVVARNLTSNPRYYIHTLRRIQQYMIPLVLNEFSFLAMGPAGSGKTSGYLLPLVNKLVELKEVELRGRRGPVALIVTHTENKIKHIRDLCCWYSRGTSLVKYFTTKEELEKQSMLNTNIAIDVICATAPTMVDLVGKFQISLKWVKFLVIEEFHFCTKDSEYMQALTALKKLLFKQGAVPVCIFVSMIVSGKMMFDINFMTEMANTKVARLIAPPVLNDVSVNVLPCKSTRDHCFWLLRLLAGKGVSPRKTVVIVSEPRRAHFLALLLTYQGVSSTFITREDTLLACEYAIRQWRTEECRVVVADYDSLRDLDYGFVEMCILFEPPNADMCSFHKRFLELSAKSCHRRRIYIMLNTELDTGVASCVLEFLKTLNHAVPQFLLDMIEAAEKPMSGNNTSSSAEEE